MHRLICLLFPFLLFTSACDGRDAGQFQPIQTQDGCYISGCSGQLCADEPQASTCEWLDSYACYQDATCARQPNDRCGWTPTETLTRCLESASP